MSARVDRGVLDGFVVDEETGQPVDHAQVRFVSTMVGVFTDSTGRFRLPLSRGAQALAIRRIGYAPYRIEIAPLADSGYVVVAGLTRARTIPCVVLSAFAIEEVVRDSAGKHVRRTLNTSVPKDPGVHVFARDALTGDPLTTPVTVIVADRAFRDSVTATVDSLGQVTRTLASNRPGAYRVIVRAPGYKDWHGSAATGSVDGCPGQFAPAVFRAWMIPH